MLAALVVLALVWLASLGPGLRFDYNRWDNFEYHTPTIIEAHSQWLKGMLPLINHHQHMGEPLLANAQPSVFYFPYTLIIALMRILGIGEGAFALMVALTHLPLMALFAFMLARSLRVRPELSWLASVSMVFSGYLLSVGTLWIFLVPVFTWLACALTGAVRLTMPDAAGADAQSAVHRATGVLMLMAGLTMTGYVGHPQFIVYSWVMVIMYILGHMAFARRFGRWRSIVLALLASALMSAPSALPVLRMFEHIARSESFGLAAFTEAGALPRALWGLMGPAYDVNNGFIASGASVMFFAGGWLVPALVLGLIMIPRQGQAAGGRDNTRPAFLAFSLTGFLLILFSLGKWGGIYGLTHGLPVWSSFRWPHKFIPYAMMALVMAGAMGLERYLRGSGLSGRWKIILASLLSGLALMGYALKGVSTLGPGVALSAPAALFCIPLVPWFHSKKVLRLVLVLALVSSIGVTMISHSLRVKTFENEEYASVGRAELGIEGDYRALPLSYHDWRPGRSGHMQEYGMFQSATANGYDSLTGCTTAMAPWWYKRYLQSNAYGLLPGQLYDVLLGGPFLKALNVRYYMVAKDDTSTQRVLKGLPDFSLHRDLGRVMVMRREGVLPRAYFASGVVRFDEFRFNEWATSGASDLRLAYVEDLIKPSSSQGAMGDSPEVRSYGVKGGRVEVEVDAPDGGFLVVANTWYPSWRAYIDGKAKKLYRVNGVVQGILVPKGARRVELVYGAGDVYAGLALSALGLVLGAFLVRRGSGAVG